MLTISLSRQINRFVHGLLAAACLLLLDCSALASDQYRLQNGTFVYVVSRNGEVVGQQRMDILSEGSKLTVTSDVQIDVSLLGLNIYGFRQHVEEVRQDGALVSLYSEADDDGKMKKVTLDKREGDRLLGDYNGSPRNVNSKLPTSTFWDRRAMDGNLIIDSYKGKAREVMVINHGQTLLKLPIGTVKATHFTVTGEMNREVWYDPEGVLVAEELVTNDGSRMRQELLRRP